MSNLICPFCQQELEEETFSRGRVFVSCNNPNCIISDWGGCSKQIITELIRTRKALGVALDWLEQVVTPAKCDDDLCREFTKRKLAEIKTALEQKESAFVHNKIKFPEFNDNLLEEFDKQFFENGQDDI